MCLMCLAKSIEEIYVYLLKQSMPRQGTEILNIGDHSFAFCETINAPSGDGNSQRKILLMTFFSETINAPSGDGNYRYKAGDRDQPETINAPSGDGNPDELCRGTVDDETINAPSGDGNPPSPMTATVSQ